MEGTPRCDICVRLGCGGTAGCLGHHIVGPGGKGELPMPRGVGHGLRRALKAVSAPMASQHLNAGVLSLLSAEHLSSPPQAALVAQLVKNLPAKCKVRVQSLSWDDLLEKGMATHSSILAWKIPWTEKPGELPAMRS